MRYKKDESHCLFALTYESFSFVLANARVQKLSKGRISIGQ